MNIPRRFIPVYTGNTGQIDKFIDPIAVYPCVYREHCVMWNRTVFLYGLSLCIQGTRIGSRTVTSVSRFIPVYTGNTPEKIQHQYIPPVYPCVYREHVGGG